MTLVETKEGFVTLTLNSKLIGMSKLIVLNLTVSSLIKMKNWIFQTLYISKMQPIQNFSTGDGRHLFFINNNKNAYPSSVHAIFLTKKKCFYFHLPNNENFK